MKRYRLAAIVLLVFSAGCHALGHMWMQARQVIGTIDVREPPEEADEEQEDEQKEN